MAGSPLAKAITPRYRLLVLLAAMAGLREGEAFGLTVGKVEFLRRRIHVHQQAQAGALAPLKTDKSMRTIPADDMLIAEITRHMQRWPKGPDGTIVTNRLGRTVKRSSFSSCWSEAVGKAGLPKGTRFHDLRHFYASALKRRGVASDATLRDRREDDSVGDPACALSSPLTASTEETAAQGGYAWTGLHQMQRHCTQFGCLRCQHVASSSTSKQQRRGKMRHLAVGRAEVFSMVGNPLPTSFKANLNPKVIQSRLGHASIAETMDTYGHLFPDDAELGRGALEALLTEHGMHQTEQGPSKAVGS
jgi:integrase